MRFKVYGPYDIGVDKGFAGWIDEEDTKDFWDKEVDKVIDSDSKKLSEACGIYLFGIHGRKKYGTAEEKLPWYVGKAEKQNFKRECFTHRNLFYFNRALFKEYKGKVKPFLYLLARVEDNDEFSNLASKEQYRGVRFVEEMFIQLSLSANSGLVNKATTKMMKETSIRGLLNTRKFKSSSVNKLKGVFGIKHEPAEVADYKETNFSYDVHGPYDVQIKKAAKTSEKIIDPKDIEKLWDDIRNEGKGAILLNACGVYVVGMRNGDNTMPWYVGTAYNGNFEEKCFKSYLEREKVVNRNGYPVIYFLPRLTKKKGNFELAKPMKKPPADMDYVKDVLLEYGVQENKHILLDGHNAEILRKLYVEGFVNANKGEDKKKVVQGLRQLLGLKK